MSEFQSDGLEERNPVTQRDHRRQVLWQITVPLIVGALVVIALAVLASLSGPQKASLWADISLIWLIIPMLFVTLIFTLLTGGLAYGIIVLIRKLPYGARRLQGLIDRLNAAVRRADNAAVEPVLKARGFSASLRALRDSLFPRRARR